MAGENSIKVGRRSIAVSSLDKVLFPAHGGAGAVTKGELIEYYRQVAPVMLRYLKGRPISLQRYPNGIDEKGFYQKEMSDYFPEWIDRARIEVLETGEIQEQVVCNDAATLVYLANQNTITLHPWLSRADRLYHPDKLIFDLDPPGEFEAARRTARLMRDLLLELGLQPFVMTTGSRGLHVVTPLDRKADFDTVRDFARDLADLLARRHPDALTVEMRKDEREGRVFLDYLRNAYASTAVAPYAVRARPGAPVATPLEWEELDDLALRSDTYTLRTLPARLARVGDPWRDMRRRARGLDPKRIAKLRQ